MQMMQMGLIRRDYEEERHLKVTEPGKEILYGRRRIELSVIEHEDARVQRLKDAARMKRTDKS